MTTIRLSDTTHRALKIKAAELGVSIDECINTLLKPSEQPITDEWIEAVV